MAAKYQLITELYRRTGIAVAKNPQAWQGFLSSACRNYKCRFDEQLLIYAQRPDAVAVAKLETWNRQFKRWVNKDSKGIAVFDPKGRRNTLKYYFDVSDTHEGYYGSRPVPIWQMDERYEQAVMERLSDRFGDVESTDLASALMETAKNAVEDNLQDYFSQLKDCTKDSFLEELDDFNIEVIYRRLAANSVAFMLISRCGLDTNEFFDRDDFEDIVNFNTPATINAIGVATSDIAEMALREISQSIRNVQIAEKDQNRTFAQRTQAQYDKGRQQPERSEYNERNHLQQTGGLSYSRPNITDRARASAWQVRFDAQGLSGEAQASDLSQSADIGQAERASARGRADSTPEVGASDEAALSRAGRDRGTERESTDAVGRTDEQHPQPSGGSDTDRTDLQVSVAKDDEVRVNLPTVDEQIEMIAKAEDEKASAFAISKEDIDSVLQKGSGVADGKYRIYRQFQKGVDRQKNIEFLKNEYGTGGGTHIFPDGFSGHSWHDSKGLAIDRNGTYTNHDLVLKWSQVEKRLRELIKDNRYLNPKEKDHYADYLESVSAPQYEVDTQRKIARQRFIDAHRDLPPADKRDTLAVFQCLRCDKVAVCRSIEGVNGRHFGISESHSHKISIRVVNLEACTCIRDCIACFCIFLYDFDIALKVSVVDKVAVGLTVLADKHIKVFHQFTPLPTKGLADGINAIRHILCLGKTVLVTGQHITLDFLCIFIATCGFEEHFKYRTFFGCFNLGFPVIRMLDECDIAFDDLFIHIVCGTVQLYRV